MKVAGEAVATKDSGEMILVLDEVDEWIPGEVCDAAGQPVEGARVRIDYSWLAPNRQITDQHHYTDYTDGDGCFTLPLLDGALFGLVASRGDLRSRRLKGEAGRGILAPGPVRLVIPREEEGRIVFRVIDAGGRASRGWLVRSGGVYPTGVTGADGVCAWSDLGIDRSYTFFVSAPLDGVLTLKGIGASPWKEKGKAIQLQLPAGRFVDVKTRIQGSPGECGGAISATCSFEAGDGSQWSAVPNRVVSGESFAWRRHEKTKTASGWTAGVVNLQCATFLPPGTYRLVVQIAGHPPLISEPFRIESSSETLTFEQNFTFP